jgi:hypothetical protein
MVVFGVKLVSDIGRSVDGGDEWFGPDDVGAVSAGRNRGSLNSIRNLLSRRWHQGCPQA